MVAPNPTPMTYHGTNSYFIEGEDGLTLLDPGPDNADHVKAVLDAAGGRIARILLSHTHHDHLGGLAALKAATGAPVYAFHAPQEPSFAPDIPLHDGDQVGAWTVIHTPGHAADHVCFARDDGVVLTADHVMGWSTTVVGPPHGNMTDYFHSLRRLLSRADHTYLPGHGPILENPHSFVRALLIHRQQREASIASALQRAPTTSLGLVDALYSQINPVLRRAAERNVLAHLDKLRTEGRAVVDGELWRAA